jgi:hypothetical protein
MKAYFGKELRAPIHDALVIICDYFNRMLDIKKTTLSAYEAKVASDSYRNNTVYAITDSKPSQYADRNEIFSCIKGGYLGSTELKCGLLNNKGFFEQENDGGD